MCSDEYVDFKILKKKKTLSLELMLEDNCYRVLFKEINKLYKLPQIKFFVFY